MKVSTRLWLGYSLFLLFLVLVSVTALMRFSDLGGAIDTIMRENYRSAVAANTMIEALERQDSAYLAHLMGKEIHHRDMLQEGQKSFEKAYQIAWSNITLPGEKELLLAIKNDYTAFIEKGELMKKTDQEAWVTYSDKFFPLFNKLKQSIMKLVTINQDAMVVAERKARNLASFSSASIAITTVIGLFVVIGLGHIMTRTIITPLRSVTRTMKSIASGNLENRAFAPGRDEIAELARAINIVTDNLENAYTTEKTKVYQAQLLALSLLNAENKPAFILDGSDRIVLFNKLMEPLFEADNGHIREEVLAIIKGDDTRQQGLFVPASNQAYSIIPFLLFDSSERQIGQKIVLELIHDRN